MLVEVRGATFGYGNRQVVRVERLDLELGRCLGIYGPNGAGKTTLLRGILGLLAPLEGVVKAAPGKRAGYMPQNRALQLHWPMSGMDVAAMGCSARSFMGVISYHGTRRRVRDAMATMGVKELADRPYATLSGGQQQRLLLAGLIAAQPTLLALDEPTDGLDVRTRDQLLQHLIEMRKAAAMVVITHDVDELEHLAHEVAWVHPPVEPNEPSTVELIAPRELANRVAGLRVST